MGPLSAIAGRGTITVEPSVAADGRRVLIGVVVATVVATMSLTRRHRYGQIIVLAGAVATSMVAAAPNVGRAQGLVAVAGAHVGVAALWGWRLLPRTPPRAPRVVVLAVAALLAGELLWVRTGSMAATVIAFAVALAVVAAHQGGWRRVVALEVALRRPGPAALRWAMRSARAASAGLGRFAHRVGLVPAAGARRLRRLGRASVGFLRALVPGWPIGGAVATCAVVALFGPVMWAMTDPTGSATYAGINDLGPHLDAVGTFSWSPFDPGVPHFLFHATASAVAAVTTVRVGATVVLTASFVATFLAAAQLCASGRSPHRSHGRWPGVAALCFVLFGTPAIALMWIGLLPPTTLLLTVHALFSPTWVVALPLSILTVGVVEALLEERDPEPSDRWSDRRLLVALAALVVLGTLAKPSFTLCLVPALGLHLVVRRIQGSPGGQVVLATVAAAALPVLVWQRAYLVSSPTEIGGGGVTFQPGSGPPYGWAALGWPYALPLLWPVLALAVGRRRFVASVAVQVVLWCSAASLALFTLFTETGVREGDGNLGVSLQASIVLLILLSVRFLAHDISARVPQRGRWDLPRLLIAGVTAVFVFAGVLSAVVALGWADVSIDWTQYQ